MKPFESMKSGGKYDGLCKIARDSAQADGALLIIMNGKDGSGFSAQIPEDAGEMIPTVLRQMADQIEEQVRQVKGQPEPGSEKKEGQKPGKLTSENVSRIFFDCLFRDGEDTSNPTVAETVASKFGFHPERVSGHKAAIWELLAELPDEFHTDKGGGWSFLMATQTQAGQVWGHLEFVEQLLALGIATGQARILLPRAAWKLCPGGAPYFSVGDLKNVPASASRTHSISE